MGHLHDVSGKKPKKPKKEKKMAEKKVKAKKYSVLYTSPDFVQDSAIIGSGISKQRAEEYVAEMKACQPGKYEIREG